MLLEGAMDWTDLGLLVAGAILGYLVQVIGDGWRNVSDDHELWADLRSTTLEAQPGSVGDRLEYTSNGKRVLHPHLVDFYFWSAGKKDITSDMFDDGRSLEINFGVPIVSELEDGSLASIDETAVVTDPMGSVVVDPSIIRKRMASHYRFITDGAPIITTVNPIANVSEVRSATVQLRQPSGRRQFAHRVGQFLTVGAFAVPLALIVVLMVWGIGGSIGWLPKLAEDAVSPASLTWLLIIFFTMFIAGVVTTTMSGTLSRRPRHAVRVLRASLSNKRAIPWIR
ncbi:MAG: hypothetical protein CMH38_14520 [Microbacterium sp.]|nr:hypothetical protein [Microbacterium sp.]HBR88788.1 hypothetical protein [Microbacterium sp.]|tara:strand:- start:1998 stop:2846 length:849 start_codon:yes stop_codon:yes gene_type:complete